MAVTTWQWQQPAGDICQQGMSTGSLFSSCWFQIPALSGFSKCREHGVWGVQDLVSYEGCAGVLLSQNLLAKICCQIEEYYQAGKQLQALQADLVCCFCVPKLL